MSDYRFQAVCRAHPNVVSLDGENDAWDAEGNVVELDESGNGTKLCGCRK